MMEGADGLNNNFINQSKVNVKVSGFRVVISTSTFLLQLREREKKRYDRQGKTQTDRHRQTERENEGEFDGCS